MELRERELRDDDISFVYSSWLKSFRDSPTQRGLRNGVYYARQKGVIDGLIVRGVDFLVLSDVDGGQIFGWCCHERAGGDRVLHFVYVKHFARGNGLMGRMLRSCGLMDGRVWTSHYPAQDSLQRYFERVGFEYEPDLVNFVRMRHG